MSSEPLDNSHPDAPAEPAEEIEPLAPAAIGAKRPSAGVPLVAALALAVACAEPWLAAAKASNWIGPAALCAIVSGLALAAPGGSKLRRAAAGACLIASLAALAWLAWSCASSWQSSPSAAKAAAAAESMRRLFWSLPAWAGLAGIASRLPLFGLWASLCAAGAGAIAFGARLPF